MSETEAKTSTTAQLGSSKSTSKKRKHDWSPRVVIPHYKPSPNALENNLEEGESVSRLRKKMKKSRQKEVEKGGSSSHQGTRKQAMRSAKLMMSVEQSSPLQLPTPKRSSTHRASSTPTSRGSPGIGLSPNKSPVSWKGATHELGGDEWHPSHTGTPSSLLEPESPVASWVLQSSSSPSNTDLPRHQIAHPIQTTPKRIPQRKQTTYNTDEVAIDTPSMYVEAGVNFLDPDSPSPLILDEDLRTKKLNEEGFVEVPNCEIIQREIEAMEEQLVEKKRIVKEQRRKLKGKQREVIENRPHNAMKGYSSKRMANVEMSDHKTRSQMSRMSKQEQQTDASTVSDRKNSAIKPGIAASDDPLDRAKQDPGSSCSQNRRLFVRNITSETTESDLRAFFTDFSVGGVSIPRDRESGAKRNIAFVSLKDVHEAATAILMLSGKHIRGHSVELKYARAPTPTSGWKGDYEPGPVVQEQRQQAARSPDSKASRSTPQGAKDSTFSKTTLSIPVIDTRESRSNQSSDLDVVKSNTSKSKHSQENLRKKLFERREFNVSGPCTCVNLPSYFTDGREIVSLASWGGEKLQFLAHANQVSRCRGHSKSLISSCQASLQQYPESELARAAHHIYNREDSAVEFAQDYLSSEAISGPAFHSLYGQRAQSSIGPPIFYGSEPYPQPQFHSKQSQPIMQSETQAITTLQRACPQASSSPRAQIFPKERKKKKKKANAAMQANDVVLAESSASTSVRSGPATHLERLCGAPEPATTEGERGMDTNSTPLARQGQREKSPTSQFRCKRLQPLPSFEPNSQEEETTESRRKRHQSLPVALLEQRSSSLQHAMQRQVLRELQSNTTPPSTSVQDLERMVERFEKLIDKFQLTNAGPAIRQAPVTEVPSTGTTRPPAAARPVQPTNRSRSRSRKSTDELRLKYPELPRSVPVEGRASDERLIQIGKIVNGYQRHLKAPYAFSWGGRIYAEFYRIVNMRDSNGVNVFTNEEQRRLQDSRNACGPTVELPG